VVIASALLTVASAQAQVAKVGAEFQINGYTLGEQFAPDVAGVGSGFVVVWGSPHDGNAQGIFASRFASTGRASSVEDAAADLHESGATIRAPTLKRVRLERNVPSGLRLLRWAESAAGNRAAPAGDNCHPPA
jgi:hypothetical protein